MALSDLDCIVVGAGPAGLAAGEILHSAGAKFVILEADSQVGGRAKSTPLPEGVVFERGAMLLHGLRVMTWEAVVKHGLTTHGTYYHEWFNGWSVTGNTWTDEPIGEGYSAEFEELGRRLLEPANDGRSLFDVIEGCPFDAAAKEQMLSEFAELVPLDAHDVDARTAGDMFLRESPHTALFELVEGYSELWHRLSAPFADRIRVDSPVSAIRYTPDGVEVSTGSETIRAASAIITVSVGVLQSGAIEFTPSLPPEKSEAIACMGMAPLIKVAARFRRPFWEAAVSDAMSFRVPSAKYVKIWYPLYARRGGFPVLVNLLGAGSEGLTGDVERIERAVHADLEAAFGHETIAEELVEILVEDWPSDPLALGAAASVPVGGRHFRATLAAPMAPLFWAGEGCATDGHAECVEGAITTGRTAAIEALHCVRAFKPTHPNSRLDWTLAHE